MKLLVVTAALILAALGVCLSSIPAKAGLEAGKNAYLAGDYEKAFQEFLPLAEAGDPLVQNQIAAMYYQGQGVTQDYAKAAQWFGQAAEHGSVDAQYLLGKLYYHGQGVARDQEQAAKWLGEAALGGKIQAQSLLALLYFNGQDVQKNDMKGYYWALVAERLALGAEKEAATALREKIERGLNPRQIESVRDMAARWIPRKR